MPGLRTIGAVLIAAATLAITATTTERCLFAQSTSSPKTVRGALVSKNLKSIQVQVEGEQQARNFILARAGTTLDPKVAEFVRELRIGSEVEVTPHANGRNIVSLSFLSPPGTFGLVTGVITKKTADTLDIQDDAGKTEHYLPQWAETGFSKEILQAIGRCNVGDRVEIRISVDDHRRVCTLRVLSLAAQAAAGSECGSFQGQVVEKGLDWITIQSDSGDKQRYLPQPIAGTQGKDLDKDVLKAIAYAKVGQKMEGRWFQDGERRLYYLKPVAAKAISK